MPTIKFSDVVAASFISGSGNVGNLFNMSNSTLSSSISGGTASSYQVFVYKGTIPTFGTFTDRATRSSDLLITFNQPSTTNSVQYVGIVSSSARYLIGRSPTLQAASASGIASWFLMCKGATTILTDKAALLGTIGTVGSGSDMEVGDVNIVSGQNYTCAGIYMNFPKTWTF